MRTPVMALLVALMMFGPALLALAEPANDLSSDGTDSTLRPYLEAEPRIVVEDIIAYLDDQDGDKLLDAIQLVSKIVFNQTGEFVIITRLSPVDESWWLSVSEPYTVKPAVDSPTGTANEATLPETKYFGASFEGWKLNSRKVNGYLVARVEVQSASGNAIAGYSETLEDYFRYPDFEPAVAGARVIGIDTPVKLDFDGNGRHEILEMPVQVDTTTPGLYRLVMVYRWSSTVVGEDARFHWQTVTNESQLQAGINVVPMWISGGHILTSQNISVSVYIYKSAFAGQAFRATYDVLDPLQYERPSNRIHTGAHTETGIDSDSDGLFDLLKVEVGLDVVYPGDYSMSAVLLPSRTADDGTAETGPLTVDLINRLLAMKKAAKATWKWTYGQGESRAEFLFDGRLVNAWGHDGSFDVYVFWYGPAPFLGGVFGLRTIEFEADDFVHPVPPLEFGMHHADKGVSKAGTELFDGLMVSFNAHVNTPGLYTAFAVLYNGDGKEVAYSRAEGHLEKGAASIDMVFPGQSIYLSRASGTFTAVVWVQGAGYSWNDTTLVAPMTARHITRSYEWEQFTPPRFQLGPKDPQPVEDLTFVLLRTDIMAVRIDRNNPDLTFYMTEDDGTNHLLRVMYTRLLAISDENADGAPQAGEIVYTSSLFSYDWDMTQISLVEDPVTGRVASFSLSTTVDLVEHDPAAAELARPLSTVEGFARLTLNFSLASRDTNRTDDVGTYLILGGAELKVDIHIEVLTPIEGIDFLTIEQVLRDDRNRYRPDPTGEGASGAVDELRRYVDTEELKQRIEYREGSGSPGFYSWVRRAEVTKVDGTEEVVDVLAAYMVTDGRVLLYLSYPYDVNTSYVLHDPSLGIFEGGIPFIPIPEEWRAIFDPMLYGLAAVAAVAVVYGMRGRRGRPEEEDEMEWEDDGPLEPEPPLRPAPPQQPDDGIPTLPDEPVVTNGSTILQQPPPTPQMPVQGPGDGWAEVED